MNKEIVGFHLGLYFNVDKQGDTMKKITDVSRLHGYALHTKYLKDIFGKKTQKDLEKRLVFNWNLFV